MEVINDLNLKKQADDLGISVWQTPGFLFLMLGMVAFIVMGATFLISRNYDSPEVLIVSESLVAVIILVVGNSVIRLVGQMAGLNKMKSEFVSIASHQLRTPLSAIRWETELLLSKNKKGMNAKQVRQVETISDLSCRMTRLVNDLLDVARIDQNRLMLKKEALNFQEIVSNVITGFIPIVKERGIQLVFSDKKKIPRVIGDSTRLKLVVENLLNNAIKYTANNGRVEIRLTKQGNRVIFDIKDNGVGIPEEQQSRVFEKFFRSDNAVKYQTEGTGLGLYISKNIIEQMGGEIWFKSVEGLGTVFSFSLRVKKNKEEKEGVRFF